MSDDTVTPDDSPSVEPADGDNDSPKFTRGPIFDIMSDEEITDATERILGMIDETDEDQN